MAPAAAATDGRTPGLAFRIFLAIALVVLAALGGALLLTSGTARRAADRAVEQELSAAHLTIQEAIEARARTLRQVLAGQASFTPVVARLDAAVTAGDRGTLLDVADELRSQVEAAWILLTDRSGHVVAWTLLPEAAGDPLGESALVARALSGESTSGIWIEPTPEGDSLFHAVSVPLREPSSGNVLGAIVAALPLDAAFAERLRRQTGSQIVFAAPDTTGQVHVLTSTLPPATHQTLSLSLQSVVFDTAEIRLTLEGDDWIGAVGPLRTASQQTVARYVSLRSRSAALASFDALRRSIVLAFGGSILLALVAAVLVARQIARPVARLASAVREAESGRYDVKVPSGGPAEIGTLASAFRRLLGELRAKEELVEFLGKQVTPTVPMQPHRGTASVLTPGSRFAGRYEIKEILGEGGMGVVYRAVDLELKEQVAIKTLRPEFAGADATSIERFRQEIRLARRITHRNVVRLHDLGEVNGQHYITMEYIEGRSLARVLQRRGQLPVPAALTVGRQLCRALEAAHEVGVVHRDIKPANLLLDPAGVLKVMDFGIARLTDGRRRGEPALTQAGLVIGTPAYMAPEQLMADEVDARADLYAAGAVLFESLTGRNVWPGVGYPQIIAVVLENPLPELAPLAPDVPTELIAVIMRALAKRRDDRWPSASQMLAALEGVEVVDV